MENIKAIFCIFIMGIVGSNYPMKAHVTGVAHSFQSHNLTIVTMKEEFRDVKGYEGFYQVSNLGRIKSLDRVITRSDGFRRNYKSRVIKQTLDTKGYLRVDLSKGGRKNRSTKTVHVIVAESFLNHTICGHKLVVNHIDFDKTNNTLENLEIITQRENTNKKHLKSTSDYTGVCWSKASEKWVVRIYINGNSKHLGYFTNELEASEAYQKELKKIIG